MVTQKRVLVDPPFTTYFFYEKDCRVCRYVLREVMVPLENDMYIRLFYIEISASIGTPEMYWFNDYSEYFGERITPTIKIVDRYLLDGKVREDPVKVLHLWDEKGAFISDKDIKKTEMLKKHIVEAVNNYSRICNKPYHNLNRLSSVLPPRRM